MTWTSKWRDIKKIYDWLATLKLEPMFVASYHMIEAARQEPTSLLYQCEFEGLEHYSEGDICELIQDYLLK